MDQKRWDNSQFADKTDFRFLGDRRLREQVFQVRTHFFRAASELVRYNYLVRL